MPLASKVNFNSPVYNPQWAKNGPRPHERIGMPGKSQIKKLLRPSGIYQIRCNTNGKIYIGSAVNMLARWAGHRRSLQRGAHPNKHLQEAWNSYGEENFEFTVLEYVTPAFLLRAEQEWIDKSQCADRKIGFNICPFAGSPRDAFAQVWEGFIDPHGNGITIFNLQKFCRQHGLDFPSMHRLAMGKSKLKSYKGWTHKNSVRKRDYVKTYDGFINPEGRSVGPITNLAAFCRERGLDETHMIAVVNGRICSHRGWTHKNGRQKSEPKAHTGFVNPDGQRVIIVNLLAFCREHGLHPVHMHQLKNGQRKSHKGWTWREDGD
jgi:group I intron endonuclease